MQRSLVSVTSVVHARLEPRMVRISLLESVLLTTGPPGCFQQTMVASDDRISSRRLEHKRLKLMTTGVKDKRIIHYTITVPSLRKIYDQHQIVYLTSSPNKFSFSQGLLETGMSSLLLFYPLLGC